MSLSRRNAFLLQPGSWPPLPVANDAPETGDVPAVA
jgi:hypothetical protein